MPRLSREEQLHLITAPDRALWETGAVVAGMDEVGRGPLAGPVTVACVVMPPEPLILGVNDSKKLSPARREKLYSEICEVCLDRQTAWIPAEEIDRLNILEATRLAFTLAFGKVRYPVTDVMIDALTGLSLSAKQHILIHGDALSYSIAAASIVAKVERDRYMTEQDALYPAYGFARNKGYGTAEHIAAIREHGPCPLHRRSFIHSFWEY